MSASKMIKPLLAASVLLALYGPAQAQDAGWYAGAGVGASRAKIDDARIEGGLSVAGFATTSIQNDDSATGYKMFGGYQFTPNFSLEGSVFDLGRFGFQAQTNPMGSLNGSARFEGAALDVLGRFPIGDQFSVYGRLGVTDIRTSDDFSGSGNVTVLAPHVAQHGGNYKFGFGVQYDLSRSWAVRAEAERYRVGDAVGNHGDIDLFSLNLVYQFGAQAAEPIRPVAVNLPPPIPAPAVLAPPPVVLPASRKLSIAADSLFEFGQARLSGSGKAALDQFANDIKAERISQITVTGHTDRLGGAALNQALSQRRADAVMAYLVGATGLPASSFIARGVDGTDPVTQAGQCVGVRATPALVKCLQPDRRVEVKVTTLQ